MSHSLAAFAQEISLPLAMTGGAEIIEEHMKQFLLVISAALVTATLPQLVPWLRKIPYTLALVMAGMGLAIFNVQFFTPSPELILWIFLPPLLFEASWNLHWSDLKRELIPISLFVTIGVVITITGIALSLWWWTPLTLPIALLVGACLSATDPVAVSALLRELGAPPRLKALVEGESMFNDGTAVVAFSLLVGIALGSESFEPQRVISQFFLVVGIGLGVGTLLGFGISFLTQRFDLPLVEQSLTLLAAYSAYLIAEILGGSGVIGTVTVGLILGNFGSYIGMNPRTRLVVNEFWEFIAFFVNSILFLLIGAQVRLQAGSLELGWMAIAIVAMLVTRLVSVYGLSWLSNRFSSFQLDLPIQTMLYWSGLRGGVSLALVLSIPEDFAERDSMVAIVFGVVLFTILVQGLTAKPLLEALRLVENNPLRQRYLEVLARQMALERMLNYLQNPGTGVGVDLRLAQAQATVLNQQLTALQEEASKLQRQEPELLTVGSTQLQDALLTIETDTYAELVRLGRLPQELPSILERVPEP
uniref:Sodium/hydrogen exchanger n=1 Tax=Cyanothece sp. (strain PCC 7425 / ATCC 29141) TaxID=395961 RepID=B8HSH0_CYAP4